METIIIKPLEVRDIIFDFADSLVNALGQNDRIASAVVSAVDTATGADVTGPFVYGFVFDVYQDASKGYTAMSPASVDTWVQVLAGGGSHGQIYLLSVVITTRLGLVVQKEKLIQISNWFDEIIHKSSNEILNWGADFSPWWPFRATSLLGLAYLADGTWTADGSIYAAGNFPSTMTLAIVVTRVSDAVDTTLDMLDSFEKQLPSTTANPNPLDFLKWVFDLKAGDAGELYEVSLILTNLILYFQYDLLLEVR